jgi:hypothetical protein
MRIKPTEIRECGEIILKTLGVLLVNISRAAQERENKQKQTLRVMSAPLVQ